MRQAEREWKHLLWHLLHTVSVPPGPSHHASTANLPTQFPAFRLSGPSLWRSLWPLLTLGKSLWGSSEWYLWRLLLPDKWRVSRYFLMWCPRLVRWRSSRLSSHVLVEAGTQREKGRRWKVYIYTKTTTASRLPLVFWVSLPWLICFDACYKLTEADRVHVAAYVSQMTEEHTTVGITARSCRTVNINKTTPCYWIRRGGNPH